MTAPEEQLVSDIVQASRPPGITGVGLWRLLQHAAELYDLEAPDLDDVSRWRLVIEWTPETASQWAYYLQPHGAWARWCSPACFSLRLTALDVAVLGRVPVGVNRVFGALGLTPHAVRLLHEFMRNGWRRQ